MSAKRFKWKAPSLLDVLWLVAVTFTVGVLMGYVWGVS